MENKNSNSGKRIEEKKIRKWTANSYQVILASPFESISVEIYTLRALDRFAVRNLPFVKREYKRIQEYAAQLSTSESDNWVNESFFKNGKKEVSFAGSTMFRKRVLDNNFLEEVSLRNIGY